MKRIKYFFSLLLFLIMAIGVVFAQDKKDELKEPYAFTDVKVIPTTSVKNQNR